MSKFSFCVAGRVFRNPGLSSLKILSLKFLATRGATVHSLSGDYNLVSSHLCCKETVEKCQKSANCFSNII